MSSGGITQFLQNTVDLSGYFPAYEVLQTNISMTNNFPSLFHLTLTLTRNRNNVTNYIVLPQPYIVDTNYSISVLSTLFRTVGIYNKLETTFKATVSLITSNPALSVDATIWFVVIYPYEPIQPIVKTINYVDKSGNPIDYFPQYMTSSKPIPIDTNITKSIDLTPKNTNRIDYYMFGSFYDSVSTSDGLNATKLQQAFYYTVDESKDTRYVKLVNNEAIDNIKLETLVLYKLTIPTNKYTSNYIVNINNTYYPLSNIFPLCEFFAFDLSNSDSFYTVTVSLKNNITKTKNYVVLASFVYNSPGSGGTYDPWEGINSAGNIMIDQVSLSSFRATFGKTTGDNWNGGIRCLVIYY